MRYVTVIVYPDPETLHPVEHRLAEDPSVTRKAIHAIKELDDGTVVLLAEVAGDLDRYREIMETSASVHEFAVSGEGTGYCYSRVDPTPLTRELMASDRSADFILKTPIEYTDDGGQRVTLVGREEDFSGGALETPPSVDVELESTGPYHPDAGGPFADLTERQREVLAEAVRLGYYENPRQATLDDVAAELGVGAGTVGKHLRNVESAVFSTFVT